MTQGNPSDMTQPSLAAVCPPSLAAPKFSVVVQGNLHPHSLASLAAFREVGPVYISYWEGNDEGLLSGLDLSGVTLIRNAKFDAAHVHNRMNVYYQILSTMGGLYAASTPYVIKVRSDESYRTLAPVLREVLAYPLSYVSTDIYFRAASFHPCHPSDHLIAGQTALLLQTFFLAKRFCENYEYVKSRYFLPPCLPWPETESIMRSQCASGKIMLCPETILGRAFLQAKSVSPDKVGSRIMQEHFRIVASDILGLRMKNGLAHWPLITSDWPEIHSSDAM